jgi:predicted NBD/HSP70 family sugar kinase/predicted transcriptional regulator
MQSRKPKSLKKANMGIVLDVLRKARRSLSTTEISNRINLSKTTVRKIIDAHIESGFVVSAGKGDSTDEGGKRPEMFRFNSKCGYVISIHVTPDILFSTITDLDADIVHSKIVQLDKSIQVMTLTRLIAETIREFRSFKGASDEILIGIVVALPGLVDSDSGISLHSPHYPAWGRNIPIKDLIHRELGSELGAPLFVGNVNRYQAFAELEKGTAHGSGNFLIVDALDEGLGAGIILRGSIHSGAHHISGEVGHMIVSPHDETQCICGAYGCLEAMVSAKRVLRLVREGYDQHEDSILFLGRKPEEVTLELVSESAAAGDPFAQSLIDDVAEWYAVGLNNIVMVTDPELILLQGVYTRAGDYFVDRVRKRMREIGGLPDVEKRTRVEYSTMGDERGALGGAAFAICTYFQTTYLSGDSGPLFNNSVVSSSE